MARRFRKRGKGRGQAVCIAELAPRVVAGIVPSERLRLTIVQIAWSDATAAPGHLREVSWPAQLTNGTLTIHVLDNQWLHELTYLRDELLIRIQKICPRAKVENLRLRVGPLAKIEPLQKPASLPDPPCLADQPSDDTVEALRAVTDPTLAQAMANARMALAGHLRR